jgi:hypothetical protein
MVNDSTRLKTYQAALQALSQDRRESSEERADVDSATAALFRICARLGGQASPLAASPDGLGSVAPPEERAVVKQGRASDEAKPSPYDGLSISEAATEILRSNQAPLRAKAIIRVLEDSGYEMTAAKPEIALATALTRRAGNYGDVVRIGFGTWALRDWYSKKKLASLQHKARTAEGMERAKANGNRVGALPKLNEHQAAEFKRLVDQGVDKKHILSVFPMSVGSYYNYRKMVAGWKPGEPWPPSAEKDDEPPSSLGAGPSLKVVANDAGAGSKVFRKQNAPQRKP